MLSELRISNLGVVAYAELELGKGLNVLTGETGAGKTMILNALTQTLGAKADSKLIRDGATKCLVESNWQLTENQRKMVGEFDDFIESAELILGRQIELTGKSRSLLNGVTSNTSMMADIGECLVQIFGQAEQRYLTKPQWQLSILDAMGDQIHKNLVTGYAEKFKEYLEIDQKLKSAKELASRWVHEQRKISSDLFEYDQIQPKVNEDVEILELIRQREELESKQNDLLAIQRILDDENTTSLLSQIDSLIKAMGKLDDFSDLAKDIYPLRSTLNEIENKLVSLLSNDSNDLSLEDLFSRKAVLQNLIRKHNCSLDEIIENMETNRKMISSGESPDVEVQKYTAIQLEIAAEIDGLAKSLTKSRVKLAKILSEKVTNELSGLKMSGTLFVVELTSFSRTDLEINGIWLDRSGADQITFGIAHGEGGTVRPVAKAASGGELSRIMLALQVVVPAQNPDLTYIFDEVDAGIGGETAIEVGRRLAELAKTNQVLVVTHLPQVAAFADRHFKVSGDVSTGLKTTDVYQLDEPARELEIARMLGGLSDSKAAISHAKELLSLKR